VALIDDDEVEGFRRDRGAVADLVLAAVRVLEAARFLVGFVEFLAAQGRIQALDNANDNGGVTVERAPAQMLNRELLAEEEGAAGGR